MKDDSKYLNGFFFKGLSGFDCRKNNQRITMDNISFKYGLFALDLRTWYDSYIQGMFMEGVNYKLKYINYVLSLLLLNILFCSL